MEAVQHGIIIACMEHNMLVHKPNLQDLLTLGGAAGVAHTTAHTTTCAFGYIPYSHVI